MASLLKLTVLFDHDYGWIIEEFRFPECEWNQLDPAGDMLNPRFTKAVIEEAVLYARQNAPAHLRIHGHGCSAVVRIIA